jgi:hypothetical protein
MSQERSGASRATRLPDRGGDFDVIGTEVSSEEADAEDETLGAGSELDEDPEAADSGDDDDVDPEINPDEDDDYEEIEPSRTARSHAGNRLEKFSKRLARQERLTNEVRAENRQLAESNRQLVAQVQKFKTDDDLTQKRAEGEANLVMLRAQLKAAKEAGETDKEIEIIERISDVKAEVKKAEAMAEASRGAAAVVNQAPQRFQRLAAQWKRKHQRYNTDENFKAVANAMDVRIANDGFDKNTDEYWRELDRRMKKLFPKEYGVKPGDRRPRHPAAGPGGDEDASPRRPGNDEEAPSFQKRGKAFVLTQRQLSIMRTVGLDPDSDEDRKVFVRENL